MIGCVCVSQWLLSDSETPWTVDRLWNYPGKNTGVGCHFLLQGIFLTQGSNPGLLHCRQILYHLSHQRSPMTGYQLNKRQCYLSNDQRDLYWLPWKDSHENRLQIQSMSSLLCWIHICICSKTESLNGYPDANHDISKYRDYRCCLFLCLLFSILWGFLK